MTDSVRTRFAPSPTGALHLGNARTALLNGLFAAHHGGRLLVRSEDSDAERSDERYLQQMLQDLLWLGLDWDEGPDRGGAVGPYRQSERQAQYQADLEHLCADDHAYPCFCTPEELEAARKRQLAAGRPPRYPGTCARLSEAERAERRAAGRVPTLRFRVPDRGSIAFDDLVYGRQTYRLADIGDFIIARGDGTPAFFFANAIDDARMGVSHVLRGEDHLSNTPRQLLLLQAVGLDAPRYGHFGLTLGDDGQPLSKRHGAVSVADLRADGYRPEALVNHLLRLGYTPGGEGLLTFAELAADFDASRLGHGGARHESRQLEVWQRRAIERLDVQAFWEWLQAFRPADVPDVPVDGPRFAAVVQPNVERPADGWRWARALFDPEAEPDPDAGREINAAGPVFYRTALGVQQPAPHEDFRGWARAVGEVTGARGRGLFRPLRAALTGAVEGPELADAVALMPPTLIERRLRAAAAD
ncbi:MAG: glutamate--tRNA ligase [Halofilum sp. (in: g-proteobacteria)]